MLQIHVTKNGRCTYCGAKVSYCEICGKPFTGRKDKTTCGDACRMEKSRELQKEILRLLL